MLSLYVSVPVACFRKGLAREYLETEQIPPPATCYGFLLSLVGETDRRRHIGARVTCSLVDSERRKSVVLRTVWRVKYKPLGSLGNTRPDYQELLTGVKLIVWLDSSDEESEGPRLEDRVRSVLDPAQRASVSRFGGLSLGESTHLVDEVCLRPETPEHRLRTYLLQSDGLLTLPVWVDHVGSEHTRYVTGDFADCSLPPEVVQVPRILPPATG